MGASMKWANRDKWVSSLGDMPEEIKENSITKKYPAVMNEKLAIFEFLKGFPCWERKRYKPYIKNNKRIRLLIIFSELIKTRNNKNKVGKIFSE